MSTLKKKSQPVTPITKKHKIDSAKKDHVSFVQKECTQLQLNKAVFERKATLQKQARQDLIDKSDNSEG